jgi:hypothetical protein
MPEVVQARKRHREVKREAARPRSPKTIVAWQQPVLWTRRVAVSRHPVTPALISHTSEFSGGAGIVVT